MAISLFKSFRSTVTPFIPAAWIPALKLLVDPGTGAPVGIQSQNASGPDGIWTPVDLTAAQIAAPTAAMLADLNATYRLSVPPYTRYHSDGDELIPMTEGAGGVFIPDGVNDQLYSPLTVYTVVRVEGQLRVVNYPA